MSLATFVALALAMTGLRLATGAVTPLTEDEAYYRLWSLRPDFGYFDHPPMIAWWIWLGLHIAGDTALGVRLLPSLACLLTSVITIDLANLAGVRRRAAYRAAIWLNATILVGIGGLLAVPDAPNTLFFTLAIWCAFKARAGGPTWWLACGAAAGLACLSKYSALFLAPGLLVWLLIEPEGRRCLQTPWPWLAVAIALGVFAPNVAWNATNHWATFAKQFGRVRGGGLTPQHLPEFFIDQALLLNPVVALFLAAAVRRRLAWPLLAIAAPFALYLVIHSLHDEVQGQWPAPLYPLAAICAARAADDCSARWRRARALVPVVGLIVSVVALAFISAPLSGKVPFLDPAAPLRGWRSFAAAVGRRRAEVHAAWVGAASYGLTSQLSAYLPDKTPTTEIRERFRFSFELPSGQANFDRPGLIVDRPQRLSLLALQRCFRVVRPLPELHRGRGTSITSYVAYFVEFPRRDIERIGC